MNDTNPELLNTLVNPDTKMTKQNQLQTLKLPKYSKSKSSETSTSTKTSTTISGIFIAAAPFFLGVLAAEPISALAPELINSLGEMIPYLGLSFSLMTIVTVAVWFRRSSDTIVYSAATAMSLMIGLFCGLCGH